MFTDRQIERMLGKLRRFEDTLDSLVFKKVASVDARAFETAERLYEIPDESLFRPVESGFVWGCLLYTSPSPRD